MKFEVTVYQVGNGLIDEEIIKVCALIYLKSTAD